MLALILLLFAVEVSASSHREAPLISNDPLADNVDLYAFRSPDNPDMINLIATYIPMQLPHGGPNYYNFGENIRYEIHVDNDAGIPGDEITYRFTFSITNEDPTTFFNIRLGAQNQKATYTLERSMDGGMTYEVIVMDGVVPPNNIGERSITSPVGLDTTYDALFQGAITTASTGETVFAGPTDDPFFVDLAGIFDLGDSPRQVGNSMDGLACYNVSALAIQVPITTLLKAGASPTPVDILDPDYVIGVWASASRPAMTTISSMGEPTFSGDWVQVSRLGMPLTNEAVIPVGQKDFWNAITPYDELAETTMDEYFFNPELALYMDDDQFGGAVPAFGPLRIQTASLGAFDFSNGGDGLFSLKGSNAVAGTALDDAIFGALLLPGPGQPRSVDLWPAFHTGVPNVIPYQLATGKEGNPLAAGKPFVNNFLPNGGDMLRLNMAVPPTDRADENFSSLGLIQAAVLGLTASPYNESTAVEFIPNMDGFPNGRRLEDDVTRIELQAVSGVVLAAVGLWYDDFDPETSASPLTQDLLNVLTYSTGVEANDRDFTDGFPYLATPNSGTGECSGSVYDGDQAGNMGEALGSFYVSSNTTGQIGAYSFDDMNMLNSTTFAATAMDADGIFYDEDMDVLYQLNRSDNVINAYSDVMANLNMGLPPTLTATSTSDFSNGREIAVYQDMLVVAQDANDGNGQVNAFHVYTISPTSIMYQKTYMVAENLWGIHLYGDKLYAIEDNSNRLLEYEGFFDLPEGMINPSKVVTIEGIVRTHGITYCGANDMMILTDVGDAASDSDGAFTVIPNYWLASNEDDIIGIDEQIKVSGPMSMLGNPVDIAYDKEEELIIVAERKTQGGLVLLFANPAISGDAAPLDSDLFAGASAVNSVGSYEDVVLQNCDGFLVSYELICNDDTGEAWVSATIINGTAPYMVQSILYNEDGLEDNSFTYVVEEGSTMDELMVTDANGCTSVETIEFPNCTKLSIETLTFSAYATAQGNKILWNEAGAEDTQSYQLSRSFDGTNFAEIYRVSRDLSADASYDYLDMDIRAGISYYQLTLHSNDETTSKSSVVSVDRGLSELNIFPNPGKGLVSLEWEALIDGALTVRAFDAAGKLCFEQNQAVSIGRSTVQLDLSTIASGMYFLTMTDGQSLHYSKFIKN